MSSTSLVHSGPSRGWAPRRGFGASLFGTALLLSFGACGGEVAESEGEGKSSSDDGPTSDAGAGGEGLTGPGGTNARTGGSGNGAAGTGGGGTSGGGTGGSSCSGWAGVAGGASAGDAECGSRWRQFGTSGEDDATGVAVDGSGSVVVVGTTRGSLEGSSAGSQDAYVRKFGTSGSVEWTRQFGTSGADSADGVAIDPNGNIFVAGSTTESLEGPIGGVSDAYVRKYSSSGEVIWTRQFGTSSADGAVAVAVDLGGSVFVAGQTLSNLGGLSAGSTDAFVRKYSASGDVEWTRQFGTTEVDSASTVAVDPGGSVFVAGYTFGNLAGTSAGYRDGFVRKYSASGTLEWTRQFGTSGNDSASGVAADASGSVIIVGARPAAFVASNASPDDAHIWKYSASGTLEWTRQFGTSEHDSARAIAVGGSGSILVAGITAESLEGARYLADTFVRSYSEGGAVEWTEQLGTSKGDEGQGVAVGPTGTIYVAGGTTNLPPTGAGGLDAFVTEIVPP